VGRANSCSLRYAFASARHVAGANRRSESVASGGAHLATPASGRRGRALENRFLAPTISTAIPRTNTGKSTARFQMKS